MKTLLISKIKCCKKPVSVEEHRWVYVISKGIFDQGKMHTPTYDGYCGQPTLTEKDGYTNGWVRLCWNCIREQGYLW